MLAKKWGPSACVGVSFCCECIKSEVDVHLSCDLVKVCEGGGQRAGTPASPSHMRARPRSLSTEAKPDGR